MADTTTAQRAPAPHRGQVGRRLGGHLRDHQPGHRGGGGPGPQRQRRRRPGRRRGRQGGPAGLGRLVARTTGARSCARRRRPSGPSRPSCCRSSSPRPGPRPPSARACRSRWRPTASSATPAIPAPSCRRRCPPDRPGHAAGPGRDHQRAWSTARPWAWWPASPPTTSPWSTWPGRWRPRWPPATPWWSSRRPQDPLAIVELVRILNDVGFPPGVVNLVNGNTPGLLRRAGRLGRRRLRQLHRLDPGRRDHRREGGPDHEAHPARARRQRRLRRVRRRRREGGHRVHRLDLVVPLRARSARPRPGPWCTAASSTRWPRAWCRWRASSRWATPPTRPPSSAR